MGILKLGKSRKAQSQILLIVLTVLLSVLLIGSIFTVFTEIKKNNEEIIIDNNLEIIGEKIASYITNIFISGKTIDYVGTEKVIVNKTFKILNDDLQYNLHSSENSIVITHKEKTKEIKIHNLDIDILGSVSSKNNINILYYRNETSDWIELK